MGAIHVAAALGDLPAVAALVQEDPSLLVSKGGVDGATPMHFAAMNGHKDLARWLCQQQPKAPNLLTIVDTRYGQTPLHFAASYGKDHVLAEILGMPDVNRMCTDLDGRTALHVATMKGHHIIVKELLKGSEQDIYQQITAVDKHGHTALHLAAWYGHTMIFSLLMDHLGPDDAKAELARRDKMDWSPIHFAVGMGKVEVLKVMLESCKDYIEAGLLEQESKKGLKPLHIASKLGHTEVIQVICEHVDVNSTTRNTERFSALQLAANNGHDLVIKALSQRRDLQVNSRDALQRTALHYAARQGHVSVLKALLKSRSTSGLLNIDASDANGLRPLHLAAREGHLEVVRILLKNGANVNVKAGASTLSESLLGIALGDKRDIESLIDPMMVDMDCGCSDHMTPLHMAARNGHMGVVARLLQDPTIEPFLTDGRGLMAQHWAEVKNARKQFVECLTDAMVASMVACPQSLRLSNQQLQDLREEMSRQEKAVAPLRSKQCMVLMAQGTDQALSGNNPAIELMQSLSRSCTAHGKEGMEFHNAARRGEHRAIEQLLLEGVHDVNEQDEKGNTPLHLAAKYGHKKVVESLMKCKLVEANLRNHREDTPLTLAFKGNHVKVCEMILEHQAKVEDELHELLRLAVHQDWCDMAAMLVRDSRTQVWEQPAGGSGEAGGMSLLKEARNMKDGRCLKMLLRRTTVRKRLAQERKVYLESINAILVVAALIASVTYQGWLQPPHGSNNGALLHFYRLNAAAFYTSVATIIAGAACFLPSRQVQHELLETIALAKNTGKLSCILLAISAACVMWAFAAAGFTTVWEKKPLVGELAFSATATMLSLCWFLRRYLRLYDRMSTDQRCMATVFGSSPRTELQLNITIR